MPLPTGSPDPKRAKPDDMMTELAVAKVEGMPPWALAMQEALMSHTTRQMQGLRVEVDEAKAMAIECQSDVRALRQELQQVKDSQPSQTGSQQALRSIKVLESEFKTFKNARPNTAQSSSTCTEKKLEERRRTVTFGTFPKDTKEVDIKAFIDQIMQPVKDDIEEVFAFGLKRAERGAARFKDDKAMWKFMTDNKGQNKHSFQDGTSIYCNVDGVAQPDSDKAQKDKAVRKVVRAIIEQNGGDGGAVKPYLDTDYHRGLVWWRDERVAEWTDGRMRLMGAGSAYQEAFDLLMNSQ